MPQSNPIHDVRSIRRGQDDRSAHFHRGAHVFFCRKAFFVYYAGVSAGAGHD